MAVTDDPRAPRRPGASQRPLIRSRGRRRLAAGQVVVVGLVAYLMTALLNADRLLDKAEGMPFGSSGRSTALFFAKPLHRVAQTLGFTKPGEAVDRWRQPDQGGSGEFAATGSTTTAPAPTATPDVRRRGDTAEDQAPTTPTNVGRRVPTKDDKLRLYIAGDSMAQGFGEALERLGHPDRGGRRRDPRLQGLVGTHPSRLLRLAQTAQFTGGQAAARRRRHLLRRQRRPADQGAERQDLPSQRSGVEDGVRAPRRRGHGLPRSRRPQGHLGRHAQRPLRRLQRPATGVVVGGAGTSGQSRGRVARRHMGHVLQP